MCVKHHEARARYEQSRRNQKHAKETWLFRQSHRRDHEVVCIIGNVMAVYVWISKAHLYLRKKTARA